MVDVVARVFLNSGWRILEEVLLGAWLFLAVFFLDWLFQFWQRDGGLRIWSVA